MTKKGYDYRPPTPVDLKVTRDSMMFVKGFADINLAMREGQIWVWKFVPGTQDEYLVWAENKEDDTWEVEPRPGVKLVISYVTERHMALDQRLG